MLTQINTTTRPQRGVVSLSGRSAGRNTHARYRPEIDGLRALAVVPVILYHAGIAGFSGGYVGVDVFFVISGYLITQILASDLEAGKLSIARFYERRARRILPALFMVMLLCIPFAWTLMGPSYLKGFAESVVAVSLFASNIFFALTSNYFADGADLNPLLHTWSLGVEEQFYLVFPILLMACWRLGRRRAIGLMVAIGVASFVASDAASATHPTSNFFLAPYRAWELMLGAVLALASIRTPIHARVGRKIREAGAAIGIVLVVAAIALYDSGTPFPGRYAILPTLGTVLVLGFGETDTIVGKALSIRALVGVGLISYSAYLIHQPLFAFAKIAYVETPPRAIVLGLALATFPLAYLSWRFVESPFRRRGFLSRRALFQLAGVGSLFFVVVGAKRYWTDRDNQYSFIRRTNYGLSNRCEFADRFDPIPQCMTSAKPEVLVWGDSYAMHLIEGLRASDSSLALVQATKSVCGPLLGAAPLSRVDRDASKHWSDGCNDFNESVLDFVKRMPSIEVVLLASPFVQYVDGDRYDLLTEQGRTRSSVSHAIPYLRGTVDALHRLGKRVVLVAPPPAGSFNMGLCAERLMLGIPTFGPARDCLVHREDYLHRWGPSLTLLEQVSAAVGVPVLDFAGQLCDQRVCRAVLDGLPVFRDGGHFSYAGSALLGRRMHLADLVRRVAR